MTREDLLALSPETYLAEGWLTPDGAPRRDLTGTFAVAVCTQFLSAELSPQELALTAEAVRQILALETGTAAARARKATGEALVLIANSLRQPNNEVKARWFLQCADQVRSQPELEAFLTHLLAVERQYNLVASLSQQAGLPRPS